MMLRYSIYILALLLSVTSLCVASEEAQGAGGDRVPESETKLLSQIEEKVEPSPGKPGPQGPAGKDGSPVTCPGTDGATVGSCPPAAGKVTGVVVPGQVGAGAGGPSGGSSGSSSSSSSSHTAQLGDPHTKNVNEEDPPNGENDRTSLDNKSQGRVGREAQTQEENTHNDLSPSSTKGGESESSALQDTTLKQEQQSPATTVNSQSQTQSNETQTAQTTHTTGEAPSASTSHNTDNASTKNPSTDTTQNNHSGNEPNVANPAEGESTSTQEDTADNTDTTTTTTTTLPPELTNNKKGDADSSSSISSSVWVRVPLLIVVTLACILVC
ncbi:uncharacterized protein TM35_000601130 [Trypanosoma theileri]|uniref:Mucin TcMUCII n=1 Tax=Trypanosoma theileri TaxID=67003 RepID=A0A1X0NG33_9TRYP|nr:uncharacterized protein TM35_000601130 [Trypanosoma theileri]ORC83682.1 hypothetical protein TM35_000601130 [Trypanosoma theileri]